MLKLSQNAKIKEISEKNVNHPYTVDPRSIRPDVVDAKVYKLKSAFIKNSVFVTMSYIKHEDQIRPIEIFTGLLLILFGVLILTNRIQELAFFFIKYLPFLTQIG